MSRNFFHIYITWFQMWSRANLVSVHKLLSIRMEYASNIWNGDTSSFCEFILADTKQKAKRLSIIFFFLFGHLRVCINHQR